MESKGSAATAAFLGGLFCFLVLISIGSATGSSVAAWTAVSMICFAAAMGICWNHAGNLWFTGLLLNVTVWIYLILTVGIGPVQEHIVGIAVPIVFAYLGAIAGWTYPRYRKKRRTT